MAAVFHVMDTRVDPLFVNQNGKDEMGDTISDDCKYPDEKVGDRKRNKNLLYFGKCLIILIRHERKPSQNLLSDEDEKGKKRENRGIVPKLIKAEQISAFGFEIRSTKSDEQIPSSLLCIYENGHKALFLAHGISLEQI